MTPIAIALIAVAVVGVLAFWWWVARDDNNGRGDRR